MQENLATELAAIVGGQGVLCRPEDLMLYEYDGSVKRAVPEAVVFPTSTQQVAELARWAAKRNIPVVARGAGTGLSGGAVAVQGGIVIDVLVGVFK